MKNRKWLLFDNKPLLIEYGAKKGQVWSRKELLLKTMLFYRTSCTDEC